MKLRKFVGFVVADAKDFGEIVEEFFKGQVVTPHRTPYDGYKITITVRYEKLSTRKRT